MSPSTTGDPPPSPHSGDNCGREHPKHPPMWVMMMVMPKGPSAPKQLLSTAWKQDCRFVGGSLGEGAAARVPP